MPIVANPAENQVAAAPRGRSTVLAHALDRRHFLAAAVGLMPAALGFAIAHRAAAQETGFFRTTVSLNLRSGPSTDDAVLLVMPPDALVAALGEVTNGFRRVAFQGTAGWASGDYLVVSNGGSTDGPVIIGTAVTTDDLNLRSGPSNGNQVLRVMPAGTLVQYSDTVQFGYRYVIDQGLAGWAFDTYLAPGGGTPPPYDPNLATTTADLNLRAEPSLSAAVLVVIPAETQVSLLPDFVNGFRAVQYGGATGWCAVDYLN